MWAITCIAIAPGAPSKELSYYSKDPIAEGSIISIPLRGKVSFGLVLACASVSQLRQNIRSSAFELRKIANPKPRAILSRPFLRAAFEASMSLACPPGSLISAYTSTPVMEARMHLPEPALGESGKDLTYEPLVFSNIHSERISEYRRLARESLARGVSMLIITPTIIEAEILGDALRSGIKEFVEVVHSGLSKKKLLERWHAVMLSKHPLVIIGTPMVLSLPRSDISTIILEREGSSSYNREERPYTQAKAVAETFARHIGARFILASSTPSIDSMFRKNEGLVTDFGHAPARLAGPAMDLIDLREHKKEKGYYDPLTPALVLKINEYLQAHKPVLILAARRGLAPTTCCDDCGTTLACSRCNTPLVLHVEGGFSRATSNRKFLCHHCGQEEPASIRCRKCGSWRLTTLGIALDGVAQSAEKHFEHTPIHVVRGEGKDKEEKVVAAWQEKGGLLLSTERIIPYLPDEVPMVAIASVDAFLSIPEYTASERVFTLLYELKSRASELFVVQTRDPAHRVMKAMREGVAAPFYKEELTDRKHFNYPPFTTLIRFTSSGKKETVQKEIAAIAKALEHLSPAHIEGKPTKRASVRTHLLVRLRSGAWVDQRLLRFIRTLPPHIEIRVNPTAIHSN